MIRDDIVLREAGNVYHAYLIGDNDRGYHCGDFTYDDISPFIESEEKRLGRPLHGLEMKWQALKWLELNRPEEVRVAREKRDEYHTLTKYMIPKPRKEHVTMTKNDYVNYSYLEAFKILADAVGDKRLQAELMEVPAKVCYDMSHHLRIAYSLKNTEWLHDLHRLIKELRHFHTAKYMWISTIECQSGAVAVRILDRYSHALPKYDTISAYKYDPLSPTIVSKPGEKPAPMMLFQDNRIELDSKRQVLIFPQTNFIGTHYDVYLCNNRKFPSLTKRQFDVLIKLFSDYWNSLKEHKELREYAAETMAADTEVIPPTENPTAQPKQSIQSKRQPVKTPSTKKEAPTKGGYVDYHEYIKSPAWKERARKRMRMDRFQCSVCGTAKNLAVHHITYERLGHEDMDDLITLCKDCHAKVHENDLAKKGANHAE